MPAVTLSISASIGGVSISGSLTRTGVGQISQQPSLDPGNAGSLTTRTDNDTGVITADSEDHDVVSTDTVDVYWGSGSTAGIRRGMTATVSGTAISVDGGAGDNLPIADTEVVVDKQVIVNTDFTASEVLLAAVGASYRASVQFQQSGGTAVKSLDVGASGSDGEAWAWCSQSGDTTPFGADVGKFVTSNGSSANTNVVSVGISSDTDA